MTERDLCHMFVILFRDLNGKRVKVVVVAVLPLNKVEVVIYCLVRAPPCGKTDMKENVQNWLNQYVSVFGCCALDITGIKCRLH